MVTAGIDAVEDDGEVGDELADHVECNYFPPSGSRVLEFKGEL